MATNRGVISDSLGVGIATGTYGVSFGAIAVTSGLSVAQTCVLSLLMFTGASQFAFVGVIGAGGTPPAAGLTAVLLGSRNMFYGLSLSPRLSLRGLTRTRAAHIVIDESTAMAITRESSDHARLAFSWTGWSIFILWNVMTLLGALAGNTLGDPRSYGLDAAVGAAFLALLWPRLSTWNSRVVALVGATAALSLVSSSAAGVPIILGGAVAVVAGLILPDNRPR